MTADFALKPAAELARASAGNYPNESAEYRKARTALLAEEIELRRHIEHVAARRRALPPGGVVPQDYAFEGPEGPVKLSALFGDKDALVLYSYMFGPKRERPCPMCTNVMNGWEGNARDIEQRVAFAMVARSPIARQLEWKKERGWKALKFVADTAGDYARAYVSAEEADVPALNVFTRRDGKLRHFWGGEMGGVSADPGQDPRGAPDAAPLWSILDLTPGGRGKDWYPKLEY